MSQGMVSPWTTMEKATTAKATTMISCRSGMFSGSARGQRQGECSAKTAPEEHVGLTRFGGHPEAFIRGVRDAQDTPAVLA